MKTSKEDGKLLVAILLRPPKSRRAFLRRAACGARAMRRHEPGGSCGRSGDRGTRPPPHPACARGGGGFRADSEMLSGRADVSESHLCPDTAQPGPDGADAGVPERKGREEADTPVSATAPCGRTEAPVLNVKNVFTVF